VLLVADGDKITVGKPLIEGYKVIATCQGESKGEKIMVFHYKQKVHNSKKTGHRQIYTSLMINTVMGPGDTEATEAPKKRVRRKKVADTTTAVESTPEG